MDKFSGNCPECDYSNELSAANQTEAEKQMNQDHKEKSAQCKNRVISVTRVMA